MKNLNLLLAGVFFCVAAVWTGLLVTAQVQLGSLGRAPAEEGGPLFPAREPGLAIQGRAVYLDLGCVACHTQQVRPAGQGSDIARGYGVRPSVARDYVLQPQVLLGQRRVGPDLANYGARAKSDAELAAFLAAPAVRRQPSALRLPHVRAFGRPSGVPQVSPPGLLLARMPN